MSALRLSVPLLAFLSPLLLLIDIYRLCRMQQHMSMFLVMGQLLGKADDIRPAVLKRFFPSRDLEKERIERDESQQSVPMEYGQSVHVMDVV